MEIESNLRSLAAAVQLELNERYREPGESVPGSALDQEGLRNGADIVNDYIEHHELGLAFEHFLYMASEPQIPLSLTQFRVVESIGRNLGMAATRWDCLNVRTE